MYIVRLPRVVEVNVDGTMKPLLNPSNADDVKSRKPRRDDMMISLLNSILAC